MIYKALYYSTCVFFHRINSGDFFAQKLIKKWMLPVKYSIASMYTPSLKNMCLEFWSLNQRRIVFKAVIQPLFI